MLVLHHAFHVWSKPKNSSMGQGTAAMLNTAQDNPPLLTTTRRTCKGQRGACTDDSARIGHLLLQGCLQLRILHDRVQRILPGSQSPKSKSHHKPKLVTWIPWLINQYKLAARIDVSDCSSKLPPAAHEGDSMPRIKQGRHPHAC